MCPPAPVPPPADIGLYWTNEELCMCLEKLERGSPLPGNVIADINPYQHMPSHLPEGIWYIIPSDGNKTTELGFWKARGEANKIFTNSVITGWRTTLEFYEGQTPQGRRTNWVMQEYKITPKELCHNIKKKDSKSLCSLFHTGRQSPNVEMHPKHGGTAFDGRNHPHSTPLTIPKADGSNGQGSRSECQVKKSDEKTGLLTVAERFTDPPAENLHELDYILRGDYLELHDLVDPKSPSSSSDNSSCLSLTSEECFDYLELQDLEDGNNKDLWRKDSSFKLNVSASVRPNEVVMPPPTLGSLISGCGSKLPVERTQSVSASKEKFIERRVPEHAVKRLKANHINGGTSNFSNVAESSSTAKPVSEGKTEPVVGRMKKLKKKYLCFMPF